MFIDKIRSSAGQCNQAQDTLELDSNRRHGIHLVHVCRNAQFALSFVAPHLRLRWTWYPSKNSSFLVGIADLRLKFTFDSGDSNLQIELTITSNVIYPDKYHFYHCDHYPCCRMLTDPATAMDNPRLHSR